MTHAEIQEVVLKHLRQQVDGLNDTVIDPSQSMADLGASSLDLVEIVSATMRELQIRVPRTQLAGLKSIRELVELLHVVKSHAGNAQVMNAAASGKQY